MTTIIAFAGRKGSGKSACSQVLTDIGYADVKFADPLKNMLRAMYRTAGLGDELIERKIEGDLKEVPCKILLGKTPRFAMQKLGEEWRNMIGEELWTSIFVNRVTSGEAGDKIVCSDLRYPHESAALRMLGALKDWDVSQYLIKRPSQGEATDDHGSEAHFDKLPVNGTFHNDGTLEDLQQFIREMVWSKAVMAKLNQPTDVWAKVAEGSADVEEAAPQITGTLHNWSKLTAPSGATFYFGEITGDTKGRFADGTEIRTSEVMNRQGDIIFTWNSVYRLANPKPTKVSEL